jgi:peptidoglycan/LPS O-acetylase OafA/YrhL
VAQPAPIAAPAPTTRRPAASASGFAWLRLLLALIVVADHSWPLTNLNDPNSLPASWHFIPGDAALTGFFAMSAYQVANSWSSDPSWWRYLARRILRIWPPLLTVVLISTVIIGPLVTTMSAHDYWTAGLTWGYLVHGAELYKLQHLLPGVFWNNPYPFSVNGSLWTLPMETTGYLLILVLGLVGLLRRARWLLFLPLAGFIYLDAIFMADPAAPGGGSFLSVPIGSLVSFMVPFAMGLIMYAYRKQLPFRPWIAAVLIAGYVAVHLVAVDTFLDRDAFDLMFAYVCITAAHHLPKVLARHDRWARGSYGLYVWGFPIQQLIVLAGIHNHWQLVALALPASYVAGLLSWWFIETPTEALRAYLRRPKKVARTAKPV